MHGSLLRDTYFAWSETLFTRANDLVKLNNAITDCLINLNNITCNSISLNISEYQQDH